MNTCQTCGNSKPNGALFCPHCGGRDGSMTQHERPVGAAAATIAYDRRADMTRTKAMPAQSSAQRGRRRFPADVVFVFDCTSSMGPYISGMKDMAIGFSRDLEDNAIDARLGLVEFRDLKIGEETRVYGFAGEPDTFRSWIGVLKDSGGGDEPESAIDGMYSAMGMDFRPDATRIAALITDAPPHDPGENGHTMSDLNKDIRSQKLVTYVIGPEIPGYVNLANAMGGVFFNIRKDAEGFRRIVKSLGKSISETVPRMRDIRAAADAALARTRVR